MSTLTAQPLRRRRLAVIAAGAAAAALLATASPAAAQARAPASSPGDTRAASSGSWGTAEEVPGLAALNTGGYAEIVSVSCASAGNCSAGGFYIDSSGNNQAFVVSQVNGKWEKAKPLNRGGFNAEVGSVSCASAGNCSAGGVYTDSSGNFAAFVVSQADGTWGTAKQVPGLAALDTGQNSDTLSVSCASAGNCSAGGFYATTTAECPFVVSQVGGTWGTAEGIPGCSGPAGTTFSVSCASAGNCSAGGFYGNSSGSLVAFVVSEVGGAWGTAEIVPAPNPASGAAIHPVSCASAGNCSAAGSYTDSSGHGQVFVVSQVNGAWGTAEEIPGLAALNTGGGASLWNSLSCASAGNCSAAGTYKDGSGHTQAFVVSQVGGTWGTAKEVPGTATLNKGGNAGIGGAGSWNSLSCASAGNCSTGGSYKDSSGHTQAFVVSQVNGTWGTAKEVPGTATLNKGGNATINGVSCATAGNCGAGGFYTDSSGHNQAFVVNKT
jgi:hypothetical protein